MLQASTRQVVVLANRVSKSSPVDPDTPIIYPNHLDIARDGTIWFTASVNIYPHRSVQYTAKVGHLPSLEGQPGFYDTLKAWALGCCQGLPMGRLLKYDPRSREVHVVAKGLWFANGVALSEDESYIALSETDRLRVLKFWLAGPKVRRVGAACVGSRL
jgi:sugar lactone lactonase YvrE